MPERKTATAYFDRLSGLGRGIVCMVGAGACFAVMMALVRAVSGELHPFQTAFFRNLFGTLFMVPWIVHVGWTGLRTERFPTHLLRSLFGLAAMLCLFYALSRMPLAEVTALTFTAPLFTTAGAALILRETVRLRRWTATLIGFVGAVVILRPGVDTISPSALIALTSAAFMAAAMLSVKALSRTENPNAIVLYMGLLVTPLSLIPALLVWTMPALGTWVWLVLMGLAATCGQLLLTRAFASADASAVLPFDFARLIFVAILAYLLFGEQPDVWTWIGAAIIVSATVYIARRESRIGASTLPPEPLQ